MPRRNRASNRPLHGAIEVVNWKGGDPEGKGSALNSGPQLKSVPAFTGESSSLFKRKDETVTLMGSLMAQQSETT